MPSINRLIGILEKPSKDSHNLSFVGITLPLVRPHGFVRPEHRVVDHNQGPAYVGQVFEWETYLDARRGAMEGEWACFFLLRAVGLDGRRRCPYSTREIMN